MKPRGRSHRVEKNMSLLWWLLTQKADAPTQSSGDTGGSSAARQAALSGSGYEEQSRSLSPSNNPLSPTPGVCTANDLDGDRVLEIPPPGIDFDFNRGPSMGVAPEPQAMDCSVEELITRLDMKHPGFRIRWIKASTLNLSRTSTADRMKLLIELDAERTLCQSGSY